ncbi:MAG: pyridoxine 5'-phosphate synthase [Gemmatimonadota bacterium]
MMRLHINIDHVATVRQARRTDEPDPVRAAVLAELGGADGITVHLREDRRHIQERDVRLLAATVRTGVNLELAAVEDVLAVATELRPMEATLVPEKREEVTTEGGLALIQPGDRARIGDAVARLKDAGIRTSLFIDPEPEALHAAVELGADAIELHTGEFAERWKVRQDVGEQVARLRRAAALGVSLDLDVHAGHGLTYENVALIAALQDVQELNIGHTVISRALFVGMEEAVREMVRRIREARSKVEGG